MGTTPILGLRYPELPVQADGPAAFLNLASDVEAKMTNCISGTSWNGDVTIPVAHGTQAAIFTQDVAATAIGWAWVDVNIGVAVNGPVGGTGGSGFTTIQNAGGFIIISNNLTELRRLRWHSRQRAELFYVSGGCAVPLPSATTLIQLRIVMSTDAAGTDGFAYETNVGLTQFGAAR